MAVEPVDDSASFSKLDDLQLTRITDGVAQSWNRHTSSWPDLACRNRQLGRRG